MSGRGVQATSDGWPTEWQLSTHCGHSIPDYRFRMPSAEAKLRDAIEASYVAFASMPRPERLDASPVHDADDILRTLTAAPLRELTEQHLALYSRSAITTVGDDRDFRHFLPRILELSVGPMWIGAEPAVIAIRLNMASWRDWPEEQRSAVLQFFRSAFARSIEGHPNYDRTAVDWFSGLAILGDSPSLIFERWRSTTSANAALNLAAFIIDEAKHIRRHQEVRPPFWEDVNHEMRRDLAERLTSEATREFLAAAKSKVSEEDRFYFLDAATAELQRKD